MSNKVKEVINSKDKRPFFYTLQQQTPIVEGGFDNTSNLKHKPDLFGNKKKQGSFPSVEEVFYNVSDIPVPKFLLDTSECRSELAQYYQSVSRIDQGLARLVELVKSAGIYDKTMIVFTSDHGMAFPGAKTTVYEPGLKVPFIVRDPYQNKRGIISDAIISHVDITPSLLDFAGALEQQKNRPKNYISP